MILQDRRFKKKVDADFFLKSIHGVSYEKHLDSNDNY